MRKYTIWGLFAIAFIALLSFSSCDPYRKLAKSNKIADKDSAAVNYYRLKKYDRAVYLFEELVPIYRGTTRAEEVYFYYAYCRYYLGELVSASFHFEDFASKYPNSSHAQEFEYMAAKTYHMLADPYYLDQKYTYKAIEYYQLFLSRHPYSEYTDKCMAGLKDLRERLAKKSYEQAYLYYKIGYNKAAVAAFQTMIDTYPDSDLRENAQYYLIKAAVKLAAESAESKRLERYDDAIGHAERFEAKYPDGKYTKDAQSIKTTLEKDRESFLVYLDEKKQSNLFLRLKNELNTAKDQQDANERATHEKKALETLNEMRNNYPNGKFTAQAEKLFDKFEALKDDN